MGLRRFNLLIILILLVVCSSCGRKKNDLFDVGLSGNVKTMIRYSAYLKAGDLAQGAMIEKISFNKEGNITEELGYDSKGELSRREETFYNEKGEKVKTDYYDGSGILSQTCFYSFDREVGKKTATYRGPEGDLKGRVDYWCDQLGNDTLRISYDKEMNEDSRYSSIWGKNGKVLFGERYDSSHVLTRRECFHYNSDDALSRIYFYSVKESEEYELNYQYEDCDSRGNYRVMKIYDKDRNLLGGNFLKLEYY